MSGLLSILLHDVYVNLPSESGFPGAAAHRYKLRIDEFETQLAGLGRARSDVPVVVADQAKSEFEGRFAVTVDDGGISYYTLVADRLEALGWRGHCFVTTGAIGRSGFLDRWQIRDLRARGHVIGSHSVTHPLRFSALGREEMVREWRQSRQALADILGEDVTIASLPGGSFSTIVANAASAAGFRVLFTSEPEIRIGVTAGCTVLGRYTIRAACKPDFSNRLGRLEPFVRFREWLIWNAKQRAKSLFALGALQRHSRYMVTSLPSGKP